MGLIFTRYPVVCGSTWDMHQLWSQAGSVEQFELEVTEGWSVVTGEGIGVVGTGDNVKSNCCQWG